MRVFVAGATGAIGKRLVPKLIAAGHQVIGTTRSAAKLEALRAAGAEGVVVDALDGDAVIRAVEAARPDAIVHELTALPANIDLRRFDAVFAQTNALRTRGTDHLVEAAQRAGVQRFVAQSFAGWPYAAAGAAVKGEDDPLETDAPRSMAETLAAIRHLESRVTEIGGVVLRYAMLYGPPSVVGNGIEQMLAEVRKRRLPVVGSGAGVWSFVHIEDAAEATRLALEKAPPGIYNIADDDPAPASELFPELARIVGAKPPMHVPAFVAKLMIGAAGIRFMTTMRGASNAKAKQLLGWTPRYASWREGFRTGVVE